MKKLKGSITDTWYLPEVYNEKYKGVINFYVIDNGFKGHYLKDESYLIEYVEYCGDEIIYEESHVTNDITKVSNIIRSFQIEHNILI